MVQAHVCLPGQGVAASGVLEHFECLHLATDRWSCPVKSRHIPAALGERQVVGCLEGLLQTQEVQDIVGEE
jgi:hypothetical protein